MSIPNPENKKLEPKNSNYTRVFPRFNRSITTSPKLQTTPPFSLFSRKNLFTQTYTIPGKRNLNFNRHINYPQIRKLRPSMSPKQTNRNNLKDLKFVKRSIQTPKTKISPQFISKRSFRSFHFNPEKPNSNPNLKLNTIGNLKKKKVLSRLPMTQPFCENSLKKKKIILTFETNKKQLKLPETELKFRLTKTHRINLEDMKESPVINFKDLSGVRNKTKAKKEVFPPDYYDEDDPFIDDTEIRAVNSKFEPKLKGFYIFAGRGIPMVEKKEKEKMAKKLIKWRLEKSLPIVLRFIVFTLSLLIKNEKKLAEEQSKQIPFRMEDLDILYHDLLLQFLWNATENKKGNFGTKSQKIEDKFWENLLVYFKSSKGGKIEKNYNEKIIKLKEIFKKISNEEIICRPSFKKSIMAWMLKEWKCHVYKSKREEYLQTLKISEHENKKLLAKAIQSDEKLQRENKEGKTDFNYFSSIKISFFSRVRKIHFYKDYKKGDFKKVCEEFKEVKKWQKYESVLKGFDLVDDSASLDGTIRKLENVMMSERFMKDDKY